MCQTKNYQLCGVNDISYNKFCFFFFFLHCACANFKFFDQIMEDGLTLPNAKEQTCFRFSTLDNFSTNYAVELSESSESSRRTTMQFYEVQKNQTFFDVEVFSS